MGLSNTATPRYYGQFREEVMRGNIPVCNEVSLEMNRIDALIANRGVYYDEDAVEGFIQFCECELTLTDGADLVLLDSFKLWAEQVFGWYYFVELYRFTFLKIFGKKVSKISGGGTAQYNFSMEAFQ